MKAGQAPSCQAAERDEGVVGSGGGGESGGGCRAEHQRGKSKSV